MPDSDNIKITINVDKNKSVQVVQWTLVPHETQKEDDRVSIEWGNLNYAFFLDNERPRIEIRNLDKGGEIASLAAVVPLPNFSLKKLVPVIKKD